jgi:hypothetical protein
MPRGRQEHADSVVDDGKPEVFLDRIPNRACQSHSLWNLTEIAPAQDDISGCRGQRGSFQQTDANVGGGEGRAVIDPVADEDHAVPLGLPLLELLRFFCRGQTGLELVSRG